jgi:hypothetical protein
MGSAREAILSRHLLLTAERSITSSSAIAVVFGAKTASQHENLLLARHKNLPMLQHKNLLFVDHENL